MADEEANAEDRPHELPPQEASSTEAPSPNLPENTGGDVPKAEDAAVVKDGKIVRKEKKSCPPPRSKCRSRTKDPRYCQQHFREIIGEHEVRNEELEKKEGDLRQRLETLECSMPAVMVWNIWRMAQGAPVSRIRRVVEKQFKGPGSGSPPCPSTPSRHYDCRVREIEAERKQALCRTEEARQLWAEKEVALQEQKEKIDEAKKLQQERMERIRNLEEEVKKLQLALKKATGDDTSCSTGECGELKCRQKWLEGVCSVSSIRSTDLECLAKLQDLAEAELCMKRQIAELERRECAYMRTLQQADELWTKMEGDNASEVGSLQEQLDAKIAANQELADHICELEDELEKLRKQLAQCQATVKEFTDKSLIDVASGGEGEIESFVCDENFVCGEDEEEGEGEGGQGEGGIVEAGELSIEDIVSKEVEELKEAEVTEEDVEEKGKEKGEEKIEEKGKKKVEEKGEEKDEEKVEEKGEEIIKVMEDEKKDGESERGVEEKERLEEEEGLEEGESRIKTIISEKTVMPKEKKVIEDSVDEDGEVILGITELGEAAEAPFERLAPRDVVESREVTTEVVPVEVAEHEMETVKQVVSSKRIATEEPLQADREIGTEVAATERAIGTEVAATERAIGTEVSASERAIGTELSAKERAIGTEVTGAEKAIATEPPISLGEEVQTQVTAPTIEQAVGGAGTEAVAEIDQETAMKHLAAEEKHLAGLREAAEAEAEHVDELEVAARPTKERGSGVDIIEEPTETRAAVTDGDYYLVPKQQLASWHDITSGIQAVISKCPDCSEKEGDAERMAEEMRSYLGISAPKPVHINEMPTEGERESAADDLEILEKPAISQPEAEPEGGDAEKAAEVSQVDEAEKGATDGDTGAAGEAGEPMGTGDETEPIATDEAGEAGKEEQPLEIHPPTRMKKGPCICKPKTCPLDVSSTTDVRSQTVAEGGTQTSPFERSQGRSPKMIRTLEGPKLMTIEEGTEPDAELRSNEASKEPKDLKGSKDESTTTVDNTGSQTDQVLQPDEVLKPDEVLQPDELLKPDEVLKPDDKKGDEIPCICPVCPKKPKPISSEPPPCNECQPGQVCTKKTSKPKTAKQYPSIVQAILAPARKAIPGVTDCGGDAKPTTDDVKGGDYKDTVSTVSGFTCCICGKPDSPSPSSFIKTVDPAASAFLESPAMSEKSCPCNIAPTTDNASTTFQKSGIPTPSPSVKTDTPISFLFEKTCPCDTTPVPSVFGKSFAGTPFTTSSASGSEFTCCVCKAKASLPPPKKKHKTTKGTPRDSCDLDVCCACTPADIDSNVQTAKSAESLCGCKSDGSKRQKPETKDQSCLAKISRDKVGSKGKDPERMSILDFKKSSHSDSSKRKVKRKSADKISEQTCGCSKQFD